MTSLPANVEDELNQFRSEWKAEIQRAKGSGVIPETPVDIYAHAIDHEERGQLDDALTFYRKAFRLDPHVDRLYALKEKQKLRESRPADERGETEEEGEQQLIPALDKLSISVAPTITGLLASLVSSFPRELGFLPEDETKPPPILNSLPTELILAILRSLDVYSLERFASVCRFARVLTIDSTIWRKYVSEAYVIHQLHATPLDILLRKCGGDFRQLYIHAPRVRFDGVYIAVCHYVRAGLGDNRWVNVTHLITYHRYLRFFPDGRVISLLTNEEHTPQRIVPLLKPSFRMKGLYIGNWSLHETTVQIVDLGDPDYHAPAVNTTLASSSIPHIRTEPTRHREAAASRHQSQRHLSFRMALELRSRPTAGRWNKLELQEYASVDPSTGEESSLLSTWKGGGSRGGEQEKPFWFSRVGRAWS